MSALDGLLNSRSSFVIAGFVVSWIAVALLGLIATNLHVRLARLERAMPTGTRPTPFGHLLGRPLAEVLDERISSGIRLVLILASDCPSCDRVLTKLWEAGASDGIAVVWRDAAGSSSVGLPPGTTILDDGPRISRVLGVSVAPFALSADADGRIVHAAPVGNVAELAHLLVATELDEPRDQSPVNR